MRRFSVVFAAAAVVSATTGTTALGPIRQHGRAIVEYRSEAVKAVANYEYSQRNHGEAWLLIELAVQATERIVLHRSQLTLVRPDGRPVQVATQPQFLEDQQTLRRLFQNAVVWRRQLSPYFDTRPTARTIRFFSAPGGVVYDSAVANMNEVATGDVAFKSPDGAWPAGTYRLVLDHERAGAQLPITLR